jgi:hypothetical protein
MHLKWKEKYRKNYYERVLQIRTENLYKQLLLAGLEPAIPNLGGWCLIH